MDVYHLVFLLTNVFDSFVIMKFMQIFFPPETVNSKTSAVVYTIRYFVVCFFGIFVPYPAVSLIVSLASLLLITLSYNAKMSRKIIAAISAYITMFTSELIVAAVIGISDFSPLVKTESGNSFCMILSELIALVMITIFRNFKHTGNDMPVSWTFFFAALPVSVITVCLEIQIFMQKDISDITYALSMICVLMLNFIIFYMYDSISKSFKEKMQSELAKRETAYYHHQAELICRNSEDLKHFRHDMKNRLIALQQLMIQQKNEEAMQYLSNVTEKLTTIKLFSETGNLAADSILNYKLTHAAEADIQIKAEILLPKDISIEQDDMFIIFGNLLDNAIESCEKVMDNKFIHLTTRYEQGTIFILLKNSCNGKINKNGEQFISDKPNPQMHGIGLQSIRTAVSKYNGEMKIQYNNTVFETSILLFV